MFLSRIRSSALLPLGILTACALAAPFQVTRADILVWDADAGTVAAQDGTGTWTAGQPNWLNQSLALDNQSWVDGSHAVFGAGIGTAGTVTLGGPITVGNLTFDPTGAGSYTLAGSQTLTLSNSTLTANTAGTISAILGGSTGWMKAGTEQLTLSGSISNTNSGTVTVTAGRLHLAKTGGARALASDVLLDGGVLTLASSNQIAPTSNISLVNQSSVFNGTGVNGGPAGVTQTLASLSVAGGTFNSGSGSNWTITGALSFIGGTPASIYVGNSSSLLSAGSLSLIGMNKASGSSLATPDNSFTIYGNNASTQTTVTVGAGGLYLESSNIHMKRGSVANAKGSRLVLNGDVSTGGATVSLIRRDGAEPLGETVVELSGSAGVVDRTFDIGGGGANLDISVTVSNGAATTASIIKTGTGTLTLSGAEANTFTGDMTINAGTLRLNKSGSNTAVNGNLIVNTGGILTLSTSDQIADTSGITLDGGTMTAWGTNETIAFFTQNAGGLASSGNVGHIVITGSLTLAGGTQMVINSNTTTTPSSWNVNSAILSGADILIGGSNGAGNPRSALTIGAGGLTMTGRTITMNVGNAGVALNLNGDFTGTGTNNIATGGSGGVTPIIDLGSAMRTFDVMSGTTTLGAEVTGLGGIAKAGEGLLQITSASSYAGATTVTSGTLSVAAAAGRLLNTANLSVSDGGTLQDGSPSAANNSGVSNRINTAANLAMGSATGGGTFILSTAASGGTHTQDLASVSINGGANTVSVLADAGATSTLTFTSASPYNHTAGSVNFLQNPGVGGSIVLLNAPSGAGNVSGGLLIGAFLNSTNLVAAQSGVLTAFSGWIPTGTATWTTAGSMDVNGTNPVAYGSTDINALRFNTAGAFTVTLSGTHTISSGMLLVTPNVGANSSNITGGVLRAAPGGEFTVAQFNAAGALEIASSIEDNTTATAFTKTGPGLLILTGTNTYTGITRVNEGVLRAADGTGLPVASTLVLNGGVFESSSALFDRSLGAAAGEVSVIGTTAGFSAAGIPAVVNFGGAGGGIVWGDADFNPGTLILNAFTATNTLNFINGIDLNGGARTIQTDANIASISGIISNSDSGTPASLTKTGGGTLVLANANTLDGGVTVSAGTLGIGDDLALGSGLLTLSGGGVQATDAAHIIANDVRLASSSIVNGANGLTFTGDFTSAGNYGLTTNLTGGAVLELAGNVYLSDSAAASRSLSFFGSGDRIISGIIANNAGDNAIASNLVLNGGGTLTLSGTNTYTGRTLTAGAGYLVVSQDTNLGATPAVPTVDSLIFALNGHLRATSSFTLDANRGIGIGNSGGGSSSGYFDVLNNVVLTIDGVIADRSLNVDGTTTPANTGAVNKTSPGTLVVNGNNTYSGLTTISNGILRVGSNTALGSTAGGTIVGTAAHVELADGIVVTGETITLSGGNGVTQPGSPDANRGGLQAAVNATAEWAGDVILGAASARIGVQEGGNLLVSGNISDGGSNFNLRLTGDLSGTGGLTLSGANTWGGTTEIVRGTVYLGADDTLPTSTTLDIHFVSSNNAEYAGLNMNGFNQTIGALRNNGNSLDKAELTNTSCTLSTLTLNQDVNTTYNGIVTGHLALVKNGTGSITLSQSNSFTGGTTVNDGSLILSNANAIARGDLTVNGGATTGGKVNLNNLNVAINALNGSAGAVSGIIANDSTVNATRTLTVGTNHGGGVFAAAIVDNTGGTLIGKVALTKIGTGSLTLAGDNTFTGATTITNGTLIADYASTTPLTATPISLRGGTLVVRGAGSHAIGALSLYQSGADFTSSALRIEDGATVTTDTFTGTGFVPFHIDITGGGKLVANTLSGASVTNGILTQGTGSRATLYVQDDGGLGFATQNGSNEIVRYTGATTLTSANTSSTTNYALSSSLTRTAALSFHTLQIDTSGSDVTLDMASGNLNVGSIGRGILISGSHDAVVTGTGAISGGSVFISNYGSGTTTLGLSLAGQATIMGGTGLTIYNNAANPADLYVTGGIFRIIGDRDFTNNINRIYGGGVLEIGADLNAAAVGDFTRSLGQGAGQVALIGNGGFSAQGADRVVALGGVGTAAALTWGSNSFFSGSGGDNNYTFMLGSAYSTNTLEFQNAIDLGSLDRRIEVADGSDPENIDARLTGQLSGTGGAVIKVGAGRLELTAANTYTGNTAVNEGSLLIASSGSTGTGDVTVAANATLLGTGLVQGSCVTLASNATLQAGDGTAAADLGTLTFQSAAIATYDLQSGSEIVLGISTATNQSSIDASFGGNAIGTAGYDAYVDAVSGIGTGQHDLLTFDAASGSTLTFSSNLQVLADNFTAQAGQIFNLIDWTALLRADFSNFDVGPNLRDGSGDDLAQLDLPTLSSGLLWDVSRFTTSGSVVVVPEPSRAMLLLFGLLPLLVLRRRRSLGTSKVPFLG